MNPLINQTIATVTYEQASTVLQNFPLVGWIAITWLLPLIIYIIVGCIARGRSSTGQVTSRAMITYPNYWYAILIWGLLQLALFILLLFPIWLRAFNN